MSEINKAIRFRAYDKEYGHMYQNAYPFEHLVYVEIRESDFDDDVTFHRFNQRMQEINGKHFYWIVAKDMEVMQYIGLPDRHGKEACQGDILKGQDDYTALVEAGFSTPDVSICLLKEMGSETLALASKLDHLEIVGNVWEHPHLLKQKENA